MTKRPAFYFDEDRAKHAVGFIETLKLSKSYKGQPFLLRGWQRKIVTDLFGWRRPDGTRRYRRGYISMGRKNAKTHLLAAIGDYCFYADKEPEPEVVAAANSREQAGILYKAASSMVNQSPALLKRSKVVPSTKRILNERNGGIFQAVAAEVGTSLGGDISCLLYDEIAFAKNRELYDALSTGSGARKQPLHLFTSTAGHDVQGVGYSLYKHAKTVLKDPDIDPSFYAAVFEVPEKADWTYEGKPGEWDDRLNDWVVQPTGWYRANPALGDFNDLETMREKFHEARQLTSAQPGFRMFFCNQWVQAAASWLDVAKWKQCELGMGRADLLTALRGQPCYVGLDLSAKIDLTALVLLFPVPPAIKFGELQPRFIEIPFFFMPGDDLRAKILRDHVQYDDWGEQGWVNLTPGEVVDYGVVRKTLDELNKQFSIQDIGYDPWNATQFVSELTTAGYTCTPIRQGHQSLGDATKEFEALIVGRRLAHDGNPCQTWQIGNVVTRPDQNNNIVVDKKKSAHRIDGVAAGIMALDRALRLDGQAPKKKAAFKVHVFG